MQENFPNNIDIQESNLVKTRENASLLDINGIIKVQNTVFIDKDELIKDPTLSERGFLLYKTSIEELEKIISNPSSHIFLVSKEGEKVIGYLLTYSLEEWIKDKPSWREGVVLDQDVSSDFLDKKTIYIRQIAVLPEKETEGIWLVKKFLKEWVLIGLGKLMIVN
jgi:hypothetical protein